MKIQGRVIHGLGNGKKVDMPTANLDISNLSIDIDYGVYACEVYVEEKKYLGVCNIGNRPTVDNSKTIEVLIIDFNKDIYGQEIIIDTKFKLRGIFKFNSLEDVKKQVDKDIKTTIERLK
ncbi:MAG: riboflavin kinase [Erysipelotrichaceae bacterium]|nr:riboflavin kinase [Erysipelotrichaceae bacterium]